MTKPSFHKTPTPHDANARRAIKPVICYPTNSLPAADMARYTRARQSLRLKEVVVVEPRRAAAFQANEGEFFRICCPEGSQVGDLNLWAADNLEERFYSGKTRALHGTHLSTGDRMWSCFPYLRPIATITHDTLHWYGFDCYGGGVHDVIGTRCDPYTNRLLHGEDYHHCCHSNLTRALMTAAKLNWATAERHVHDVLNVFMCTGFTRDTHRYFMKASPARAGDFLEFFAEVSLLGALSACPGGDCGSEHSSDVSRCHPLHIEIYQPDATALCGWRSPSPSSYCADGAISAK